MDTHLNLRDSVLTLDPLNCIDLAQEKLDLTLNQKTKNTSPVALRSPIHVRGGFASPDVAVGKGHVAARGLGAIALVPLIDAGPGMDSDCGNLVREARRLAPSAESKKTGPRS